MLNGFLHPMAVYSSFKEHWMFGRIGNLINLLNIPFLLIQQYLRIRFALIPGNEAWKSDMTIVIGRIHLNFF